ncbi:leucine-rich repeat receptor-like protein kinase PEPR2 [Triticum aestivum]|uniref:leucine-rich repeat receptor-like protein kinase PEPR2 n=1 Tax=Triticum aestivum TaxID=4565 RepID=UPI001D0069FA|nr:leucine-rich repeat receptor-like protein kinase PEPR2 [Triticum aestivum]
MSRIFLLLLLHLLLLLILPPATSATPPSPTAVLLSFLASLPEASQRILLPSWQSSTNTSSAATQHCAFRGVTCTAAGAVAALNLSGLGLAGALSASAPRLCALPTALSSLDLSRNGFAGPVPAALAACSGVATLLLARNRLTGPVPPELLSSRQLRKVDLGGNALAGEIPAVPAAGADASVLEHLDLSNNSLAGAIPPELLASLPGIRVLNLSTNGLTGPLPEFPARCRLTYLAVDSNGGITGELPGSLANCGNLTDIILSYNKIGGTVPDFFASLPRLQQLFLDDNSFVGELPASIGELADLESLAVTKNGMTGPVPEAIGRCKSLTMLYLKGNWFNGSIPRFVGNLSRLQRFSMADNGMAGTIPREIGKCRELVELQLQNNSLSGTIPPDFSELGRLRKLALFKNTLHGTVPPALWQMPDMEELQLYNNSLSGEVPAGITQSRKLRELILAFNNFTGEVPGALGLNTTHGLVRVDLTGNRFRGAIPAGLCTGGRLAVLVVGHNQFSGGIPGEIAKCQSLWRVRFNDNKLSGSLQDLGTNTGWSFVDLSGNRFDGRIPSVLGSWRNLTMLDLSGNNFAGLIPHELGALSMIGTLRLSLNRLTGPIPPELKNCKRLFYLDLGGNHLNGSIPAEVATLDSLQHLLLGGNKLTGTIPDSFTATQGLLELDLGGNSLEGTIPVSLGNLQYISRNLDLSNNRLRGQIPSSLGNLRSLEVLDLSANSLSGPIPSQLSNMISLSAVNVSFNELSGQLPAGNWAKLADESPDAFRGNAQLCTHPGNAPCSRDQSRKTRRRNTQVIVALLLSTFTVMVAALCAIHFIVKRSKRLSAKNGSVRNLDSTEELPEDLTYEDILRATDNLSEKYVIGKGRHGTVYKTQFAVGKQWAVKTVDLSRCGFPIEMKILNTVRHRNIVRMAGYCIRRNVGMILYEYMPEGTLFELLHERTPQVALDWTARHIIALGAAEGLSYLHHDCVPMIVHRDVKSSNILMDAELVPKITDFSMGKIVGDEDADATVSVVVGTLGYIAPEQGYSTRLTEKSDVYSYGVVLLELLTRKMPVDPAFGDGVDMVTWMRSNLTVQADYGSIMSCLDEEIMYWPEHEQAKALDLLDLAVSCTQTACQSRPSMREVVNILMRIDESIIISEHHHK